ECAWAAENGHVDVVEWLLRKKFGQSVHRQTYSVPWSRVLPLSCGHPEMLAWLFEFLGPEYLDTPSMIEARGICWEFAIDKGSIDLLKLQWEWNKKHNITNACVLGVSFRHSLDILLRLK